MAQVDLQKMKNTEYIIITISEFVEQAQKLAVFHRKYSKLHVEVVTVDNIYKSYPNIEKIVSIRQFLKALYLRDKTLEYVLLFGDTNHNDATVMLPSYVKDDILSDDYFGFINTDVFKGNLDLAIGRLPVATKKEAYHVVQKIINYHSAKSFGKWRNHITFIADDVDQFWEYSLQEEMEKVSNELQKKYDRFRISKIYLDAYQQDLNALQEKYEQASKDIFKAFENGSLVINYFGHGNDIYLASENILSINQVKQMNNPYRLPFFITVSCNYTSYHNTINKSAGEYTIAKEKNPLGGVIGLISTTDKIGLDFGKRVNAKIFEYLFEQVGGRYSTVGEVLKKVKNYFPLMDKQKYNVALIGDPALRLALPDHQVEITQVNGKSLGKEDFTATKSFHIKGQVKNQEYDGQLDIEVFGKQNKRQTLDNNRVGKKMEYYIQSFIYKGKAKITNGKFDFNFVVPKDVNYSIDNGKIVLYAHNESYDAVGYSMIKIGVGQHENQTDFEGPQVKLSLNDSLFISGDITDFLPSLYATITDKSGINLTDENVGHLMRLKLDDREEVPLNDFYEPVLSSLKKGKVKYKFENLKKGKHKITFKVWDVYNNYTYKSIDFWVKSNMVLDRVFAYPNPAKDVVYFRFNHNQPNKELQLTIRIYDISGYLVQVIAKKIQSKGYLIRNVKWKVQGLKKGVYLYHLELHSLEDGKAHSYGKIILSD